MGERVRNYALLLKPRVMSLVVFTGLAGLFLAPGSIDPWVGAMAVLCIAVGAGASGAINMWYDRDIDQWMDRTKDRPIPAGRVKPVEALWLGVILSAISVVAMAWYVNDVAAALLAMTIAYYVFLYTMWLKRRTPQNIVIGGASGAFPPMIGWAAVTGGVDWGSVALFGIIFMWTPPHFWALALFRSGDYERAGVPMLPVVSGVRETKKQIIIYSILLFPVALAPVAIGMSGPLYGIAAAILGVMLLHHSYKVWKDETAKAPRSMFLFSILYLFLIFVALLVDRTLATFF
ncbi:MAG: heme o synthase [Rhodospirillales bacterium]|nr:heme o synthase [Rhodospirillales bacterium]MCW8970453.1 heme o synthase [Rhodospirillales bacterium]MCW9003069.1 heme o synthase [Rhodospirillales bacterium]